MFLSNIIARIWLCCKRHVGRRFGRTLSLANCKSIKRTDVVESSIPHSFVGFVDPVNINAQLYDVTNRRLNSVFAQSQ